MLHSFLFPLSSVVILLVLISNLSMLLLVTGPGSANFSIAHFNARSLNVNDKLSEISVLTSVYGSILA